MMAALRFVFHSDTVSFNYKLHFYSEQFNVVFIIKNDIVTARVFRSKTRKVCGPNV